MLSDTQILTWLNGRVVNKIDVVHHHKRYTIWTQEEAITEGLTIEDAVNRFVTKYRIDVEKEIDA